eukprot:comp21491_c1_seq1/m.29788 comp21491_c1_seq1/g.29788  ORF comp21491_c1_seq1/g.29788 comp21491_c1_seq1/m.29788 type:complete len:374 (-) comp21491_c1_seq1:237-1358(-)
MPALGAADFARSKHSRASTMGELGMEGVDGFFRGIDRRTAVAFLRKKGTYRSYLLRESQSVPGSYVISFRVDPFVRNFTIVKQSTASEFSFVIGNRAFRSISDVISHYHTHPLSDDLCLGSPVTNWEKISPQSPSHTRTLRGHITTHSTRIRCYDFPSVVFQRHGSMKGSKPGTPIEPLKGSVSPPSGKLDLTMGRSGSVTSTDSRFSFSSAISPASSLSTDGGLWPACMSTSEHETFANAMMDQHTLEEFVDFVEGEHLEETLMFLSACGKYKRDALSVSEAAFYPSELHEMAKEIFVRFMTPASMYEVNISVATVREVRSVLDRTAGTHGNETERDVLAGVFEDAHKQVYDMLVREVYPRFQAGRMVAGNP